MGIFKAMKDMLNAVPDSNPLVEAEKAFKKDFNHRVKQDDLVNFKEEIEGRYEGLKNSFLRGFEMSMAKTERGNFSVEVKGCFKFFIHDIFINDKGVLYIEDQLLANFSFFGLGLGYMVGVLKYNHEHILNIEWDYESWASSLKINKPFYFEYLQEQAFLFIDGAEAGIRDEEWELKRTDKNPALDPAIKTKKSRLEEVKSVLKKCKLL